MSGLEASKAKSREHQYSTNELVRRLLALAWQFRADCLVSILLSVGLLLLGLIGLQLLGVVVDVIRYALDPQLPSIEADPSQIQQVVMNLVINAADAIGEQSGVILLGTRFAELDQDALARAYAGQPLAPGSFVVLEVADNGSGMSPEVLNRIFDPFFTTKFTGRGLGLAAIQGIVRGHQGGIQVQSEVGRGTTFRLLFPATSLLAEAELPREAVGAYQGSGTVLVVDDEESIRAVAVGIFAHIGFKALQAEDGLDALKVLRLHRE